MLRNYYIYILLFIISATAQAQNSLLSDMQGLSYKESLIFEVEGYTIIVEKNNEKLNEKGINRIKKKYELKNVEREYSDPNIKWQNYVIESKDHEKSIPDVEHHQLCYLFPETDNLMTVVLFDSPNRKDTLIEKAFMNAFLERQLSKYVTNSWEAEKINFAGRYIPLGNVCSWISPYNVHCPGFGQISWSTFRDRDAAEINNQAYYMINKKSGMYKQLLEEEVEIEFEGIPTLARRVVYKLNRSKILLGGRNELAVYYVVQKVRGRYLSCVLSHYIEDKKNYKLAPLLEEVMKV